jgi:cation diffusion facilitator family transporter
MSKFPDPIPLPDSVKLERDNRQHQVLSASLRGIFIRLAIIGLEMVGVLLFKSSALFMDALASFLDVICTLVLVISIKMAGKPPDWQHPFGHGRYEPLVGLQLGLMILLVGLGMIVQQCFQINAEVQDVVIDTRTWIFPLIAVILLEICYRKIMRVAKTQRSPALEADAFHYRIDGVASLFALIALVGAAYFPKWSLTFDHLGAIVIAGMMIGMGFYAAKNNINQLMDRIPDPGFFDLVRQASLAVQGVLDTEKIKIMYYGPDAQVDIDIEVNPEMSVEEAHKISQNVRAEIQKKWPAVRDVMVHIEPYYPNDHKEPLSKM